MALRYLPAARTDIKDALRWSLVNFGQPALRRYQRLIAVAISEVAANTRLTHSYELPALQPGIRLYHLRHSRRRARVDGQVVRAPRHFLVYTVAPDEVVIVRLLHERIEISRHLEEAR
ncbi:MAG: type II toxin-antitoxin system RelE/ParE family toxin [Opitutaceae bacterium]|nr:type II toxin-antitoxin system RelE/ParE family toxin [Opitutaceae bacterium]